MLFSFSEDDSVISIFISIRVILIGEWKLAKCEEFLRIAGEKLRSDKLWEES